jgi:hypothetical protein
MDAPRREAAQIHDIWGIGHRQPAMAGGGKSRPAALNSRSGRSTFADPAEAGKGGHPAGPGQIAISGECDFYRRGRNATPRCISNKAALSGALHSYTVFKEPAVNSASCCVGARSGRFPALNFANGFVSPLGHGPDALE